ncbi:F0F1 ATP synthase subunit B [candidate division KSB1 bacterium]|nr:F0F1 ATP synthase subunit B [candidate division KSB1 bacterium]
MQMDWFTFIAQVVNFLIIVVLLKRFLYDRIITVMDKREKRISERLQEAEESRKQAEDEKDRFEEKSRDLDSQRQERLKKAEEEAEAERKQLVQQARAEIEQQQAQWREALQQEQKAFMQELRQSLGRQVYALSRELLQDLANEDLEHRIIHVFIERLQELGDDERDEIMSVVADSDEPVMIRSSFEIIDEQRQAIKQALAELIKKNHEVQFDSSEDLICGIEMRANGRKLSWSVGGYLQNVEERISEVLKQEIAKEDSSSGKADKNSKASEKKRGTN